MRSLVAAATQFLEQALRGAPFPTWKRRFRFKDRRKILDKRSEPGSRLNRTLVSKLRIVSAHDFAHRASRHSQIAGDRLDPLALIMKSMHPARAAGVS